MISRTNRPVICKEIPAAYRPSSVSTNSVQRAAIERHQRPDPHLLGDANRSGLFSCALSVLVQDVDDRPSAVELGQVEIVDEGLGEDLHAGDVVGDVEHRDLACP